jgi:coproporphyrinogen III oxidase
MLNQGKWKSKSICLLEEIILRNRASRPGEPGAWNHGEMQRFQAKSHVTEKSEGAAYGQDITPAILNGFGDKEIFHHTAKRLCQKACRLRFFIKKI